MTSSVHAGLAAPSPWVARWLAAPGAGRRALDVACGSGRHARWLAERGWQVTGIDRDAAALASLAGTGVRTVVADLEDEAADWPLAAERFDLVLVTNYLWRPTWPRLAQWLAPGGLLVHETFAEGNGTYGRPASPAFLLGAGELLALAGAAGLRVVAFEDGFVGTPKPARVQRIVAAAPGFEPEALPLDA